MPTLRQRFFAWMLKKGDELNDRLYRDFKKELFNDIRGTVVEIGPGTGINFRYLPTNIEWIGIEPNEAFHGSLLSTARKQKIKSSMLNSSAEKILLPEETADIVISSLVLCAVPDPQKALAETKRILKKSGRFIFIEHVADRKKSFRRTAQNILNPLNRFIGNGCNCNRETWKEIEQAGFSSCQIHHTIIKGTMPLHAPHILGFTIK
jgi:ubiquinone/menaquinone biosynthesis C-methylase UbiE